MVTIAAALSDGLVTPETSFVLPPALRVGDRVIHDAELRGTERMNVSQILAKSSNIGAVTIGWKLLGKQRLLDWIYRFGFGKLTGIDFPGEVPGFVLPGDQCGRRPSATCPWARASRSPPSRWWLPTARSPTAA